MLLDLPALTKALNSKPIPLNTRPSLSRMGEYQTQRRSLKTECTERRRLGGPLTKEHGLRDTKNGFMNAITSPRPVTPPNIEFCPYIVVYQNGNRFNHVGAVIQLSTFCSVSLGGARYPRVVATLCLFSRTTGLCMQLVLEKHEDL